MQPLLVPDGKHALHLVVVIPSRVVTIFLLGSRNVCAYLWNGWTRVSGEMQPIETMVYV